MSYYDDNISITYRPSELTPDSFEEINARIEAGDGRNASVEMLIRVMVAWDVMEDKDVMMPITVENLSRMPGPLLLAINEAIGEDGRPKPKSARGSFAR
ncbi:MAG: hypothetical protein ACTS5I_02715 [Rhodanobacter sp.]